MRVVKTTESLIDDINGRPASRTIQFGIDDSNLEIDLSKANLREFVDAMAPFINHARLVGKVRTPSKPLRTNAHRRRMVEIRSWAKGQGIPLSEKGRIPIGVISKYERRNK